MKGKTRGIYGTMEWYKMAKETVHLKVRTLIKAYLVMNKGKRFTAKQISEWINSEWFGLNRALVNARTVSRLISSGMYCNSNILSEINYEKVGNLGYYWVEA